MSTRICTVLTVNFNRQIVAESHHNFEGRHKLAKLCSPREETTASMKRVSLAVGSAMAAAGLLTVPVATAHAAGTGETAGGGAGHALQGTLPNAACAVDNSYDQFSSRLEFYGYIAFAGECVHLQTAVLTHEQTGLTERVRYYTSGRLTRTVRLPGLIQSGYTHFASYPNYVATMVCQALVANGTSTVKYGQVCEYTS